MRWMAMMGLLALAGPAQAALVYDNTGTDTLLTVFYSAGGYTEIGDQVALTGSARLAQEAELQFFNGGLAGSFDAVLRFYAAGAPVGAQIGPDVVVTGIAAPELDVFTVLFSGINVVLPDEFVFTVAVANPDAGLDVGVNLFDPVVLGVSDHSFLIVRSGNFSSVGASGAANVYLKLDAAQAGGTAVPEPRSFGLMGAGLAALMMGRRRRR